MASGRDGWRARIADAVRFHPREAVALALLGVLVLAGAALAYARGRPAPAAEMAPVEQPSPSPSVESRRIVVHVVGAVRHPGVYTFAEGARVLDAVRAAGGFARDAEPSAINLARTLADGEQVVVPRRGEAPPPSATTPPGGGSTAASGGKINLNSATVTDLERLPGIGPVLAQRIVEYREQHGPFRRTRDLLKVPGIGEKKFSSLEPYVTV